MRCSARHRSVWYVWILGQLNGNNALNPAPMELTETHPLWEDFTPNAMRNVLHLSCIPTSAPVRVTAKGILVHDVFNSSSASHHVKTVCFLLTEETAACKLPLSDQHSSSASRVLSGGDGAAQAGRVLQWAPRKRICACLQPWISD